MRYITEEDNDDIITLEWTPDKYGFEDIKETDKYIDIENIRNQLSKDHNVLIIQIYVIPKNFGLHLLKIIYY